MNKSIANVAAAAASGVLLIGGTAAAARPARTAGVFGASAGAYTYAAAFVPVGSRASVQVVTTHSGTIVTLRAVGLLPDRDYGAHAHVANCGPLPTDAGGHFQYVQGGANDPAFANSHNEIWLDFTTDHKGRGRARAVVDWTFPAERRAHSVVIHDHHTATDPGTAGTAGPRYACLTVKF